MQCYEGRHRFFKLSFIEVQLIYKSVLVSGVWQSDTFIYIKSFFRFFSLIGYYQILSTVPCAIRWSLFTYFIYSSVYLLIQTPNLTLRSLTLFGNHKLLLYVCRFISVL